MMRSLQLLLFLFISTLGFGQELNNKLIWASPTFYDYGVQGFQSLNDGKHYVKTEVGDNGPEINKYAIASGKKLETIVSLNQLTVNGTPLKVSSYTFSKDDSQIMFSSESEAIYRRSTKAYCYVYTIATKKLVKVGAATDAKISNASLSPDGKNIAYVRENNLYITNLSSLQETQVTTDGKYNTIINGMCDWVYEEEFGYTKAFEWSPDGQRIAYIRFDEKQVPEMQIPIYNGLYPSQLKFKYPKAGEKNSVVSAHIYNLADAKTVNLKTSSEYIAKIAWAGNSDELGLITLNRLQNELALIVFPFNKGGVGETIYTDVETEYIEIGPTFYFGFTGEGRSFIITSEKADYNQLYYHANGKPQGKSISQNNCDVAEVYGYDTKRKQVYYQAACTSAINLEVYYATTSGKRGVLLKNDGVSSADFTEGYNFFIGTQSSATKAPTYQLYSAKGKALQMLKTGDQITSNANKLKVNRKEYLSITNSSGIKLNAWMIKPLNFDENKQYPVLMTCYNGPGSNMSMNEWGGIKSAWHHYIANQGYFVVCVEGRGTMYRGEKFKKATYKQLGKLEVQDQIDAAKHLASLPYIDGKRIAMQGWSYGGFMALACLSKGADVFKTAISVAPVTNWRFYDTIYTERYMALPQDNASGYDENSPLGLVNLLQNKFLLVHGTADDNVHFQNTTEYVNALVEANKDFDFMAYPNKNHGIYGGNTRLHLFNKISNFIFDNL